jgi:hypothetical protein
LKIKINGLQRSAKLAEMLQGFFPPAEGSANIEYKWKDNGNTEKGKIYIVTQVEMDGKVGYQNRNGQNDHSFAVYYGSIEFNSLLFSNLKQSKNQGSEKSNLIADCIPVFNICPGYIRAGSKWHCL